VNNLSLSPRLQKLVDMGESGTDILHGELKSLMLESEKQYLHYQQIEEETDYDDAMDSMERKYYEGQLDAYATVYQLTYELAFAISDRRKLTNPS
jgi:hypothetical protein